MTESKQMVQQVTLTAQAFVLLCRLYDSCYDELKQNENMTELVESTAHILLTGVETLEGQEKKPGKITFPLSLPQAYLLRRLVVELLGSLPTDREEKTAVWWQECLRALSGDGDGHGAYQA